MSTTSGPRFLQNRYRHLERADLERLLIDAEQALQAETESDARRLLNDLQLHQIELEIANRELMTAQGALEASREQFVTLFDFAPVAYLRLDRNGYIVQANLAAARLFARPRGELERQPLTALLTDGGPSRLLVHIHAAFAEEGTATGEFRSRASGDEGERNLRLDSSAVTWVDGSASCLVMVSDITELRTAERELRESHHELSTLIAAAPTGIGVVREGVFQSVSPRLEALLGYSQQGLIGKRERLVYADEADYQRVGRRREAALAADRVAEVETVWRRRDGTPVDVLMRSAALDTADPRAGIIVTLLDISARKRIERDLKESQRMLDLALSGGEVGSYTAALPEGVIDADVRYLAMLGYRPGELALDWDRWRAMIHPDDWPAVEAKVAPVLDGTLDAFEAEYRMRHRLGHWVWVLDRARVHARDADAGTLQTAGAHLDITRRRLAEGKVVFLAEHDELTGLLNRRGITRSLASMRALSARSGRPFALAILDLDHFKEVNDAYGHAIGDRVLREIADTLRREARSADWVGRWGGEEFIIAMPDSAEVSAMASVERLRAAVGARPIEAEGRTIPMTLSAGLAVFTPGDDALDALIRRADAALYRAKQQGRDRTEFIGTGSDENAIFIASVIQDALHEQTFEICARPIIELGSGRRVGEELQARIRHPSCDCVATGACRDIALQLGMMHRFDQRLLEAAAARLRGEAPSPTEPAPDEAGAGHIFVSVSHDLLGRTDLLRTLAESVPIPDPAVPHAGLVLSIDPAQFPRGAGWVAETLAPFLERGCRLALDDYGGVASTPPFLTELPVSFVILDPALLRRAGESARARTVLAGILRSARDLDCISLARNGDEPSGLQRLAELGVDWGLGESSCH